MSVLIKGLNIKPCKDGFGGKGLVIIGYDDKLYAVAHEQIIPLPDHGDLIDRDELMMKMWGADAYASNQLSCNVRVVFVRDIEAAPVVIPAERSVKVCPLSSDDEVTEYCVEGPCTAEMEGRCPIAERSEDE